MTIYRINLLVIDLRLPPTASIPRHILKAEAPLVV